MFTLFNRAKYHTVTSPLNKSALRAINKMRPKTVEVTIKVDGEIVLSTMTKKKQLSGCSITAKYEKQFGVLAILPSILKRYKRR